MTLQRWTDQDGVEWACAAYDHGPMCRLCQRVEPNDTTLRACLKNVDDGLFEVVGADPDGQLRFRVTEEGERRVKSLIDGRDPRNN